MNAAVRRLSETTRALARRALDGENGRALVDLPLTLDGRADLADAPPERRYAECIRLIAEQAPIRILPGEHIVGAMTLYRAPFHAVPVCADGKPAFRGVSHLTLGFDHALVVGCRGLRAEIEARRQQGGLDAKGTALLDAMRVCLDALATWRRRYLDLLDERIAASSGAEHEAYERVRENLRNVPENPPATFAEAVQSLWFVFAFQRHCGNWPGIGRMDLMLGPYLERDLAAGRITLDEARELLAHFWIRGCDWIGADNGFGGSGDAQFYQNIVLAGVDADGNDITNNVTYLVLDVVEELRISEFPIAVRIDRRTPERLLRRIAEVQRLGGGIVAVYNDETVLAAMTRFGYPLREARRYANDGCWEVQIPGETSFRYRPIDTLAVLQTVLGVTRDGPPADFAAFDDLYAAWRRGLRAEMEKRWDEDDTFAADGPPSVLIDLFERDCIARARGYYNRGARYTVSAPHAGGLPDTANSLLAIRRYVYERGEATLPELVEILRADWRGHEELRARIRKELVCFGNGERESDALARRGFDDFLALAEETPERCGVLHPAGVSTFGREILWRPQRRATADGHRDGDVLATNFSPSPGTDREGPTSVLRSHCAMGLDRLPNGTALELKLTPSLTRGESGIAGLVGLLRTFVDLGGFFMHIDVVSAAALREAQRDPECHRHLAVRVSGWSARFTTLDADWQEMIIHRTEQR